MIANISPSSSSCENTLNTLRYADRVKELKKGQGSGSSAAAAKNYDAYMPHHGKQGKRNFDVDQNAAVFQQQQQPQQQQSQQPSQQQQQQFSQQQQQQQQQSQLPQPSSSSSSSSSVQPALRAPKYNSRISTGPDLSSGSAAAAAANAAPASKPFVKPLASALGRGGGLVSSSVVNPALLAAAASDDAPDPLALTHMDLCGTIRVEEENIVEAHRAQIDLTMKGVKEEMELLKRFDMSKTTVDEYVDKLDELLSKKIKGIEALKSKLSLFKKHLQQEEGEANTQQTACKKERSSSYSASKRVRSRVCSRIVWLFCSVVVVVAALVLFRAVRLFGSQPKAECWLHWV